MFSFPPFDKSSAGSSVDLIADRHSGLANLDRMAIMEEARFTTDLHRPAVTIVSV